MNEINEQLKGISELVTRIDAKVLEITTKLDELIKALHEYDDANIEDINEGYGESSFEAFQLTNDYISSFNVDGAERRMNIIGQNGNEGLHYGIEGDNDIQDKHTVVEKKRNNGRESGLKAMSEGQPKQKRYWKNNRSKRNDNKK